MEHLDRDVAIVAEVACEIDRRHSARAKLTLHAIAVAERRLKLSEELAVEHCVAEARPSRGRRIYHHGDWMGELLNGGLDVEHVAHQRVDPARSE
jgi:hypothetical protein